MRITLCTVLCIAAHCTVSLAGDKPDSPAQRMIDADRVLIIAHRGDSKVCPENTLPAFESAVRAASDLVELDYVHTADGIPIVIHDTTLDRTTDACQKWQAKRIRVDSKSLAELEPLDAGTWFKPEFKGTKLPTLDNALDVIQNGSMTLIERKAGDAKTCIELLERKELVGDVVVQAFDWNYITDCHRLRPDLVLCALGTGKLSPQRLDAIEKTGARAAGWQFSSLSKEDVQAIHDRGLKIWAWTVDDPDDAQKLIEWGVDGIITNVPTIMKKLVTSAAAPAN